MRTKSCLTLKRVQVWRTKQSLQQLSLEAFLRMDKERPFNFKLLVPPRICPGQVSAVKPQEITDDSCGFVQPLQTVSKSFDKESKMPFPATSMVTPSKSTRQDAARKIAVMPMEKEETTTMRSSQLYSRLFEEAEKIKCWKAKMELEIGQNDRKLQENKRTIENQRKAIQELQFGNESLSMKLEEEMHKNKDLKNKSNSTRNLCSLLKETFERSAEKMHLYESEREETHHLFMQSSANIQRMINAFEGLRVQAEADRHDLLKLKEELKECYSVKEKFQEEFRIKHEEVIMLHAKLDDTETDLEEKVQNLQEAQQNVSQLIEAARHQEELLEESKQEQKRLVEKLQKTEQANKASEENMKALEANIAEQKDEYAKALVEKNNSLEDLQKIKDEQADKLKGVLAVTEDLQVTLTFEVQRVKGLEEALGSVTEELKLKTNELEKLQLEEAKALQLAKELECRNAEIHQLMSKTQILSVEKKYVEETLEALQKEQKDLKEVSQMNKSKRSEVEEQLSIALANERQSAEEIGKFKKDTEQHKKELQDLMSRFTELQLQKELISQQATCEAAAAKMLEGQLKEIKENEKRVVEEMKRAEEEKQQLRDELESLRATIFEQGQETEIMHKRQEESNKSLQNELTKKDKQIKALEMKVNTLKTKLETKTKAHEECLKENKYLKKQVITENEKYSQLETEVNELKEELRTAQALHSEELKALHEAIEIKCIAEAELQEKVQNLQITATEAVKNKEETETKCQHKISDMVVLMDKHKNQYDKMVEEKDTELDEKRKNEAEIKAEKTSLELELSEVKIDNSNLRQKLEDEIKEKENMKRELTSLKSKMKALKEDIKQMPQNTPTPVASFKQIGGHSSPKATSLKSRGAVFDFSNEQENEIGSKTPSQSIAKKVMATPQLMLSESTTLKTSWSSGSQVAPTPRIKSYRIRTPPSHGKSVLLARNTLELDPKSDSSEQNDTLSFSVQSDTFTRNLCPGISGPPHHYGNLHMKIHSPAVSKSPGTALKLAAVKRMRDAGWTAVTSSDKRKKKVSDKIFA